MMPPRRVAILQSNYIPWKGYFDLIRAVDLFIVYDDRQFTKNDWRNRNRIKAANGLGWLTIPVETSEKFGQTIEETRVARRIGKPSWAHAHWARLQQCYQHASFFADYGPLVRDMLLAVADEPMLSQINIVLLRGLCELLNIRTPLVFSRISPWRDAKGIVCWRCVRPPTRRITSADRPHVPTSIRGYSMMPGSGSPSRTTQTIRNIRNCMGHSSMAFRYWTCCSTPARTRNPI